MSATGSRFGLKRLVRRFTRPVTSPIDGRVGDINRRIAYHGERLQDRTELLSTRLEEYSQRLTNQLESQTYYLEGHATSSAEAATYIGLELRRLRDQVSGLEDHVDALRGATLAQYYEERLARACTLPLAELDQALAAVINYAAGYRGFAAQAGLWFNPPVGVALGPGIAVATTVNERIVEVPFAMRALSRLQPRARILDVGSAESTFPLSAASLGYDVTAIDPRPLSYSHPNLESFECLLEEWEPPSAQFDAAFLISTVEHVGLGAYGERPYGQADHGTGADRALLDRVRGLLAPDGIVVLTTPYGTRTVDELERTYDEEGFNELLADWQTLERVTVVHREPLVWELGETVAPGEHAVAMVVASPKRS
jgi:methyltransferase family protein